MTLLTALGIASIFVTVALTVYTAAASRPVLTGGQSIMGSLLEAWINIVIGFSLNAFMNWMLLPLVGANLTASSNFFLGCVFTAVSLVRSFIIRRVMEARTNRSAPLQATPIGAK